MDVLAHLKELCAAPGLSAYEAPIREMVRAAWEPLTNLIRVDKFGSLWATKTGSGPAPRRKAMIAAHMDAIGMMVTKVDGAFLRITEIGGVDARVMLGQPVLVHAANAREPLPAVVGSRPPHILTAAEKDKVIPLDQLFVDPGLPADEVARLVRVGDLISFAQPPFEMQGDYLVAKSLDNRASVAAVSVALEALQDRKHEWDVIAVATAQEEENLGGAYTAAFEIQPDLAVVIDVTWASAPGLPEHKTFSLGDGPTIGLGPNIHPKLHKALADTATRFEIPYRVEVIPRHSGTDAYAIQVTRAGIPASVVGIPLRNMHTPVEVVSIKDVSRTGRLVAEFLAGLDGNFLDTVKWD
ncbi:MAG: M20/M25/M40 family metallo-hydrolase [Chloroflexi bacterium]|nr:M20/M25/M40 family metallo-hydrolase [Chloroflexota bacterium]